MINTENLMEIQLSLSSPTYRGPKGDKPVKGVDYFTQEDINDIVSQIEIGEISLEGYASKEYVDEAIENIDIPEVDLSTYASKTYVDNAVEGMVVNETDPTVPAWAKQPNKPAYTASEVGALPADTQLFSGNYNDLSNKPAIPTVPVNVSAFNNDAGYLTSHQSLTDYATKAYVDDAIADIPAGGITVETDPTVPSWAKQATKPTYTANEVGALPADTVLFSGSYNDLTDKPIIPTIPSNVSAFTNDAGYLTSHQSLTDYATKSYVETAIRGAESGLLKRNVVQALPVNDIDEDTIYMVAKTGSTGDVYDEYLYVNSNWEHIGSTDVDLTDYRKAVYLETSENLDADSIAILNEIYNHIVSLNLSNKGNSNVLPSYDIFVNGEHIEYFKKYDTTITLLTGFYGADNFQKHQYVWTKDETRLWSNGVSSISGNNLVVENENSVAGDYPNNRIGTNFKYIKDNYAKLTDIPTVPPAPIVIQTTIAGQPSVVDGVYTLPLTITSNNMAEAYAQYQTHPSTVGMAVDLTALGRATKMYLDCESFYRYDDGNGGYTYETYGEFNDNSLSQSFGYEFMNVNIHLDTGELGSKGTLAGLATVNQLASKANSADLATVATSGDYNDLTNKPTIPTAYTLPTATTATLGGVKVDGTTITISDGVISAVGGGTTYTAGAGIDISNGEISFTGDFDDQTGIGFITTYENENTKNETCLAIEGLTIHSYGEPDVETGDQVDIGVDITSSGITFTNPEYGGEYTLSPRLGGLDINNALILTTSACNTAYNASSNKVATMADIPASYSLPTATTATLGGVKVDGTTITITDGVISAISSGGSNYTFTNGLTENNGTVSWDLNDRIKVGTSIKSVVIGGGNTASGSYSLAEGANTSASANQSHTEGYYTKASSANQHAEGRYNVEDSNTVFQNIAGNGSPSVRSTMFARDWNGNEYLSGNLFVGCNDFTTTANGLTTANAGGGKVATESYVDTAIANIPSGGGSSYTAGNGIDIDSNNEISALPQPSLGLLIVHNMMPIYNPYVKRTTANTTWEEFIKMLRQGQVVQVYNSPSWASGYQYELNASTFLGDASANLYYCDLNTIGAINNFMTGSVYPRDNNTFYYDGTVLYKLHGALGWGQQIKVQLSGQSQVKPLTTVLDDFNTRIPSAPTTDGNYVLKVSVSSGTPTYSWVAE